MGHITYTNLDASESDSVKEITAWSGGVNNHLVVSESDSDFDDMEYICPA
jgi:hypothetical protein